ncbi:MAG TPA: DMT family transporter [Methanomassiliicoccales archaeon]|nr:DMT family transporter [Methanomassiliicoccales archaeon]
MTAAMERLVDRRTGAVLTTLLSSLMLGTSYVAVKMTVGEVNPFLLGAATMAVGSAVLLAYMLWKGMLDPAMLRRWEFWAGPIINTGVVAPSYVGLTMTTASVAGLIIGTNVVFVALFSRLLFGERLGKRRLFGLAIALLGLITLTTRWDLSLLDGSRMTGNLLVLISAVCIGVSVVTSRIALRSLTPEQWSLSLHLMLPPALLALYFLVPMDGGLSTVNIPAALFIGIVCTTVPTVLWTSALKHISVVTSATILMVESAFAVFLSWIFLGEVIDVFVVTGAVMIFAAILLMARSD